MLLFNEWFNVIKSKCRKKQIKKNKRDKKLKKYKKKCKRKKKRESDKGEITRAYIFGMRFALIIWWEC